jgi:thiol:disulfide interchange protein DsbA
MQLGALALAAGTARLASAQGKDIYTTLDPAAPIDVTADKIQVVEFFHYGCPHCREFDPLLDEWRKKLAADVVFTRIPVIWGDEADKGFPYYTGWALLYYALETSAQIDKLHGKTFVAVQDENIPLHSADTVKTWIKQQGIDADAFMETYKSFGLQSKVRRAGQLSRAYKITSVPSMAVQGRYVTSSALTGSHEAVLKEVDRLVASVRKS